MDAVAAFGADVGSCSDELGSVGDECVCDRGREFGAVFEVLKPGADVFALGGGAFGGGEFDRGVVVRAGAFMAAVDEFCGVSWVGGVVVARAGDGAGWGDVSDGVAALCFGWVAVD